MVPFCLHLATCCLFPQFIVLFWNLLWTFQDTCLSGMDGFIWSPGSPRWKLPLILTKILCSMLRFKTKHEIWSNKRVRFEKYFKLRVWASLKKLDACWQWMQKRIKKALRLWALFHSHPIWMEVVSHFAASKPLRSFLDLKLKLKFFHLQLCRFFIFLKSLNYQDWFCCILWVYQRLKRKGHSPRELALPHRGRGRVWWCDGPIGAMK